MNDDDQEITRWRYLLEKVLIEGALDDLSVDMFTAMEAVASTAIEHPEWDMDEVRTRKEWENSE